MKTIILAAGEGKRLHPLTIDMPKAMLKMGRKTLIERAIEALNSAGIGSKDIFILSGHRVEKLKAVAPECKFIHNDVYDSTNNIYSLWLARDQLDGDSFLLLNSDVLFAPGMVSEILADHRESVLMVDDINPLAEEEMKVIVDGQDAITAIAKTLDPAQSAGEYIGLAKFGKEFSSALFTQIEEMIQDGETGVWYENAIAAILETHPLYCHSTGGLPWIEIDTHEDLEQAQEVAAKIDSMGA